MITQLLPLAAVLVLALLITAAVRYLLRQEAASMVDIELEDQSDEMKRRGPFLSDWLLRAGFNSPLASSMFLGTTLVALLLGLAVGLAMAVSPLTRALLDATVKWPWIAGFLVLSAQLAPIFLLVVLTLAPTLYVRSRRRKRVDETEQDLPLFMDLFAALAEAGVGFDTALVRILEAHPKSRTLAQEFTQYRKETMAGLPRAEGLRNLAHRMNVLPLSLFVSAVVQAEQTGASVSDTLRNQAIDGRERRKIRVLLHANTQPVRLSFPLIICFLPGLMVTTLGPALYHLLQIVDSMLGKIK